MQDGNIETTVATPASLGLSLALTVACGGGDAPRDPSGGVMHAIATVNPSAFTRCPKPTVTIDPFGITVTYLDQHETAIDRVLADRALAPELHKAAARLIANMLAAAGRIALDRQLGARATAIAGRLTATADAIPGDENVGNELLLAALRAVHERQTGGAL